MSGNETTWKFTSKRTVEGCVVLSMSALTRKHLIHPNLRGTGLISWTKRFTDDEVLSVVFDVDARAAAGRVRLRHTTGHRTANSEYDIRLTTTWMPRGGVRWWFICPLIVDDCPCGRRMAKLYLPPGGRRFGCRRCYDLTYRSCQESHRYDAATAKFGVPVRLSARQVARLMSPKY